MLFGKSITFDEKDLRNVAAATDRSSTRSTVESEFIEKLRHGDARAFDRLVYRYASDIYGLLVSITRDHEEAADLTQETFLRALKAISKFRGDADLKTWLFRIAINQSRNRFRWWKSRRREKTVSLDAPVGDSETPLGDTISCRSSSPEEKTLQREREKLVANALSELPHIYSDVLILCDIQGLSYEEISVTLEINMGTVKSRIARGREELRKKLKDY